ncbi:sigma factor-like helix-turn-helix DNA-binding protein [Kribbella monticola]|uniref:sigma factor-like helix-turn-helix DNA-binding protein n=1 Tax=Kribbella monticola TaxID=2185285 RepID=UPI000DD2F2B5
MVHRDRVAHPHACGQPRRLSARQIYAICQHFPTPTASVCLHHDRVDIRDRKETVDFRAVAECKCWKVFRLGIPCRLFSKSGAADRSEIRGGAKVGKEASEPWVRSGACTQLWTVRRRRLEQLASAWTALQLSPVTEDRGSARAATVKTAAAGASAQAPQRGPGKVLALRVGLFDQQPRTAAEIAEPFGVTRERILEIERKALATLCHPAFSQAVRDSLLEDGLQILRISRTV